MVLRCPKCSELRFFGRTQVMGEVVVCPQCETVFAWRDSGPVHALAVPVRRTDGRTQDEAQTETPNGTGSKHKP
jgi:hypothetical protein